MEKLDKIKLLKYSVNANKTVDFVLNINGKEYTYRLPEYKAIKYKYQLDTNKYNIGNFMRDIAADSIKDDDHVPASKADIQYWINIARQNIK